MINALKAGWISFPNHIEHYDCGQAVVAVRPHLDNSRYNLTIAIKGHEHGNTELANLTANEARQWLSRLVHGHLVKPGDEHPFFQQHINQAVRECEVVRWTKTRVRIAYEMPNTGTAGAWRHWFNLAGGYRLISYAYE